MRRRFSNSSARAEDADWIGVGVTKPSLLRDTPSDGNRVGRLCFCSSTSLTSLTSLTLTDGVSEKHLLVDCFWTKKGAKAVTPALLFRAMHHDTVVKIEECLMVLQYVNMWNG